jgi:hypothetical protein
MMMHVSYRRKKFKLSYFLIAAKNLYNNQPKAEQEREKFSFFYISIVITACEFFKLSQPI